MTNEIQTTDVAVIGAGPVGLFAVFQCGMLKMRCHVIDALEGIGGQCTALYPEKPIYDIPGYPCVHAAELIDQLEIQASPFDPKFHLDQQVESLVQCEDGGWQLGTSNGTQIRARAVIIAAGAGAFGPNRPPLEGLEDYESKSVFYMVRRREDLRGRRIVIAGGGDSAVDWALSLSEVAEKVYVVHRRPRFRAAPDSVERLHGLAESGKIELVVPYQLSGLEGSDGQLSAVRVATLDNKEKALEADVLLPFYGLATSLGPIAGWGLNADERHHIVVDPATSQTNQPGIFAVGDISTYSGKLKLILTGFSEVAMAAHAIHRLVYPDQELHFEYSTSKGVPVG